MKSKVTGVKIRFPTSSADGSIRREAGLRDAAKRPGRYANSVWRDSRPQYTTGRGLYVADPSRLLPYSCTSNKCHGGQMFGKSFLYLLPGKGTEISPLSLPILIRVRTVSGRVVGSTQISPKVALSMLTS